MNREPVCRIIRADSLEALFPLLESYGAVWIVCDRNVWENFGLPVAERLASMTLSGQPLNPCETFAVKGRLAGVSLTDATEENKTVATVEKIAGEMLEHGADRSVLVLGIGGGITTDIAGFTASIYKRGVRFAFVPTTLLAQVDAAIGGKNGVNFHSFKNMLGTIRQPEFTCVCPEPLRTLNRETLLSGVAEMLKTFIIADSEAYAEAVSVLKAWTDRSGEESGKTSAATTPGFGAYEAEIGKLAAKAAEIKAGIVEQDPEEHGLRRVLNLGHTFAHAIESLSGGGWTHGMAVAAGIVSAARLAESLSGKAIDTEGETFVCQSGLPEKIESDFRGIGLPTECPYRLEEMSGAISNDKKAEGKQINFVLPSSIGSVRIVKLDAERL